MTKYLKRAAFIIGGFILRITLHYVIHHPSQLMIPLIIIGLLVLGVVVSVARAMRRRRICPSCSQRGLRCIRQVRPTDAVDARSRLENTVSYYRCKSCGTNYKRRFPSRLLEKPTAEELANYCSGELQK
jgi:hypothetical protein